MNAVLGQLCRNQSIGYMHDDPVLLDKLAAYLRKWGK